MTATRIAPSALPGTLFKAPRLVKPRRIPGRSPRHTDAEHLEAIRQCPCLRCGTDPCGEAAHVRMGTLYPGKVVTGIGRKPSDADTVPLCHGCHMDQHAIGELSFWTAVGIAPLTFAARLYRFSPNTEAMRALCWVVCAGVTDGGDMG